MQTDIPSDSSGLFVKSSRSMGPGSSALNNSRRGDIHSDLNGVTPRSRRRLFLDENGNVIRDIPSAVSDAPSFSNNDPNTSDAQALGGESTRVIWGTNVSIQDTMSSFKGFLRNFSKKYRLWADGISEVETQSDPTSSSKVYVEMMQNMLTLGTTGLNLEIRNLKAYPATLKLWHQVQAYPQEVIPLMDQSIKDIMVELAEQEMNRQRTSQSQSTNGQASQRNQLLSSDIPVPSSERSDQEVQQQQSGLAPIDLVTEVESKVYKVRPFGIDKPINMRDLNPSGKIE
jgi:DNA replication licensing factor MCM4